ncbi:MAG: hypothetical protein AAF235_11085, partial [Planctomycetota bacterium]
MPSANKKPDKTSSKQSGGPDTAWERAGAVKRQKKKKSALLYLVLALFGSLAILVVLAPMLLSGFVPGIV